VELRRLQRARSGLFGGSEPTPGDAQQGKWSRQRLERMDSRFTTAVERALRNGRESQKAAGTRHRK
jgi:hypothetical protein